MTTAPTMPESAKLPAAVVIAGAAICSAPGVPKLKLKDGSAMFLPHSDQVIFYDKSGRNLFGWDWSKKYLWVVAGDTVPPKELCDQMLAEYLEAQNF